jgi:hypothetical protein
MRSHVTNIFKVQENKFYYSKRSGRTDSKIIKAKYRMLNVEHTVEQWT